jgi:peroxiredoxin
LPGRDSAIAQSAQPEGNFAVGSTVVLKEKRMALKSRKSVSAVTLSILFVLATLVLTPGGVAGTTLSEDFSMQSIDGRTVSSDDLRGQVAVLVFGASWLPLSREQASGLKKLANEYAKQGVVVYFVAADSDSPKSRNYATDEQLRLYAKRHLIDLTVLRDPDGLIAKQFGIDQLPAFVVLDKEGRMVDSPIGGLDSKGNLIEQLAPVLSKAL